jgi:hypothetical protein
MIGSPILSLRQSPGFRITFSWFQFSLRTAANLEENRYAESYRFRVIS